MDNNNTESTQQSTDTNMFSDKNFIISVLVGLLVLSFLGINLLRLKLAKLTCVPDPAEVGIDPFTGVAVHRPDPLSAEDGAAHRTGYNRS